MAQTTTEGNYLVVKLVKYRIVHRFAICQKALLPGRKVKKKEAKARPSAVAKSNLKAKKDRKQCRHHFKRK